VALAALATLWVPDTPLIVENHGDLGERNQTLAKWMARRAWAIRSVSAWTARQWDKYFRPDGGWRYHKVFPAWTDEDVFWEAGGVYERTSLFHLLYAGGPEDHKGFDIASKLGRNVPVGHVCGVTQIELARAMAKASVTIVPSRREGLGLVILESFMVGRPVVASRVGGIPEIVRHGVTGLLVRDVEDLSEWKRNIAIFEHDREFYDRVRFNAREFVAKYWTKEKWLGGYEKLVGEVLR
jgi:glycosyltransferase involved in cell wall biosynthesis